MKHLRNRKNVYIKHFIVIFYKKKIHAIPKINSFKQLLLMIICNFQSNPIITNPGYNNFLISSGRTPKSVTYFNVLLLNLKATYLHRMN